MSESDNDKPSAFVDSPEDLLLRAKYLIAGGSLSPQATLLLSDLARELKKSREGHASRVNMVAAANDERRDVEAERDALRNDKTSLLLEIGRLKVDLRKSNRLGAVLGAIAVVAFLVDFLGRLHR